jgi:hypothetical protein
LSQNESEATLRVTFRNQLARSSPVGSWGMNRAPHAIVGEWIRARACDMPLAIVGEWIRARACDMPLAMHDESIPRMRSTQRVRRLVFFNLKKICS